MAEMKIYNGEELLCTNDPDAGGDDGYNMHYVRLAPRCSCGSKPEVDNIDHNVFYAADGVVVIPTHCPKCDNYGQIQIDVNF